MPIGPLTGFVIGVTADRRSREQIELLSRKGAEVVHGPTIQTQPLAPELAVAAATRALIARPPDLTVFSTGIGVRGWFEAAESLALAAAVPPGHADVFVVGNLSHVEIRPGGIPDSLLLWRAAYRLLALRDGLTVSDPARCALAEAGTTTSGSGRPRP